MVRRAQKKVAKKKAVKKKTVKRPASRKKSAKKATSKKTAQPKNSHWASYKSLQEQVDKAWIKLQADVKKKAKPQVLVEDKNHLMLLLGECNYMARECMRLAAKQKKRK